MHSAGTVIAHLRLRAVPQDALAMRQRLGGMLSAADLEPAGLPATAIVVIRSLRDPQPGRLRLMQAGQPPLAWQQAVGQSIDALARRAARPARGFVADSAEAVVFMDRAELLACLARDWCDNAIATRWWWRSLVRDPDIARAVVAEWVQSPEYIPAAMQQLATSRQAVAFLQCLDASSTRELLNGIAERFGLAPLRQLFIERESASVVVVDGFTAVRQATPWLPWVPEAAQPTLTRLQADLLGIALLLRRAPRVARSVALVEAIQHSLRDVLSKDGEPILPDRQIVVSGNNMELDRKPAVPEVCAQLVVARGSDEAQGESPIPGSDHEPTLRSAPPKDGEPILPDRQIVVSGNDMDPGRKLAVRGVRAQTVVARWQDEVQGESPIPGGERDPIFNNAIHGPPPADFADHPAITESVANPQPATAPTTAHHSELDLPEARSVETGYGGALFLINLGLFLELYSDFSQPAKPGIELPIWDFVALLGEALAGTAIRHDPLWPLLAELAGREPAEDAGRHFTPPPEWRMPENWLTPFAAAVAWEWSGRGRRLQVRHPAGFVVLDVAAPERNYIDALAAELAPYRSAGRCASIARRAPRSGGLKPAQIRRSTLPRWCGWMLPYVRARLEAALGVTADEVGERLCACPARLRVTATHLDAHFALANLPIEVRLAGLDRDPGWVPAAGRNIVFHFD